MSTRSAAWVPSASARHRADPVAQIVRNAMCSPLGDQLGSAQLMDSGSSKGPPHGIPGIARRCSPLPSLCMMPARKFPDLTIVVAHCGGGIFLHEAILAALFCPNIVLELSSLMPHQVLEVLAQVPPERLMAGSDLPENTGTEMGKILTLDVSDECKRAILSGTACRVFGGS